MMELYQMGLILMQFVQTVCLLLVLKKLDKPK